MEFNNHWWSLGCVEQINGRPPSPPGGHPRGRPWGVWGASRGGGGCRSGWAAAQCNRTFPILYSQYNAGAAMSVLSFIFVCHASDSGENYVTRLPTLPPLCQFRQRLLTPLWRLLCSYLSPQASLSTNHPQLTRNSGIIALSLQACRALQASVEM